MNPFHLSAVALYLWLLVGHALCDYPLQGDFMARAKNPKQPIDGVPWDWPMSAHATIQAGAVWLITGTLWLAAAEYVAHSIIDVAKCRGAFGYATDQQLHILCKAVWVAALVIAGVTRL